MSPSAQWVSWVLVIWPILGLVACVWMGRVLWIAWREDRRRRANCCIHCGYDLRASNGRCPECGEPILGKRKTSPWDY